MKSTPSTTPSSREKLRLSRSNQVLPELRGFMTRNHTRIHPTVWLFFGCLLTVLWGCTKPQTDIGLGLRPPTDSLQVRVIDTTTVVFQTVREDSLETDELSTGLLGQVHLPGFSQVTAGLVTQLRLSATDINFGVNPVADSMFLQLRYTGDTYGQLLPQHLSVQPLSDSLSLDSAYHSTSPWRPPGKSGWPMVPGLGRLSLSQTSSSATTPLPPTPAPLNLDAAQFILDLDSASFDNNAAWFDVVPESQSNMPEADTASLHWTPAAASGMRLPATTATPRSTTSCQSLGACERLQPPLHPRFGGLQRPQRHRVEWRREVSCVGRVGVQNTGHVPQPHQPGRQRRSIAHRPQGRAHRSCGI